MAVGEYLIIFSAILIGLAVADLSFSLHRLMRQGRSIRWHPIVPIVGFLVLCFILNLWWGLYRMSAVESFTFLEFLPTVLLMLTLFLLAAAVFPDEKLEEGASLLEYYLDARQQIWGLFCVYFLVVTVNRAADWLSAGQSLTDVMTSSMGNIGGAVLCFSLIWTRNMIAHWSVVVIGLAVTLMSWGGTTLEAIP